MRDYPELLIIRHGQTEWNRAGIMQGHHDSALTDLGRQQARDLNRLLAHCDLTPEHRAWVSPLGRTRATAQIALAGHFDDVIPDERLTEVCVGEIEGMTLEDAIHAHPHVFDGKGPFEWHFATREGEDFALFSGRIQAWLDELTAPAVVVTHGITSRVMRALVLGLGQGGIADLPGGQGIIHRVRDGVADILAL